MDKRNQEKAKEKFKLLQPKNDFVFQSLFSEKNEKITKEFVSALLFYFSKLYAMQIGRGDEYNTSKRVVLIAIIDYELDLTKEIEEMETKWKLRDGKNLRLSID